MTPSSESFFLADRSVGLSKGAVTIASAWTWMTALFIIPLKSYQLGLPAFLVLVFVNVALLIYTGYLALKVRRMQPLGFTLPEYAVERDSRAMGFIIALSTVAVMQYAVAVHLVAASHVLAFINIDRRMLIVLCAALFLTVACWRGLVTSIFADFAKAGAIAVVVVLGVIVLASSGSDLAAGLRGIRPHHEPLFTGGLWWTFMLPAGLALMGSATFDGMLYQRAFAIRKPNEVLRTFVWAALVFAPVPLILSSLGLFAAGSGASVPKGAADLVAFQIITQHLSVPQPLLAAIILVALAGTGAAALSAAGEVGVRSVIEAAGWKTSVSPVTLSRCVMLGMTFIGAGIAYANVDIFTLWLTAGMVRAVLLVPVLALILSSRKSVPSVLWWVLLIGVAGVGAYLYWLGGNLLAPQSIQVDAIGIAGSVACGTGLLIWAVYKVRS